VNMPTALALSCLMAATSRFISGEVFDGTLYLNHALAWWYIGDMEGPS